MSQIIRNIKDVVLMIESQIIKSLLIYKKVNIGKRFKIKGKPYVRNNGEFNIGDNVRINSRISANPIGGDRKCSFFIGKGAKLIIENGVALSNSAINCYNFIKIEANVMIGGNCKIYDTDFHSLETTLRISDNRSKIKTKKVLIKKNAFIGGHCIILKGVTIGENSIIGAGSVVSKDVPDNEIWAGNPARFIKKII